MSNFVFFDDRPGPRFIRIEKIEKTTFLGEGKKFWILLGNRISGSKVFEIKMFGESGENYQDLDDEKKGNEDLLGDLDDSQPEDELI